MKRHYIPFLSLLCFVHSVSAGPIEDIATEARGRMDAIALLRQGRLADSKQRLTAALPAHANANVSTNLALGRQWTRIAFHFRTRGEMSLARQAANEAIVIASALSGSTATSSERATFLANTGLVCERILRDLPRAKSFYDAALSAHPANRHARQLQRLADEKIRRRSTPKDAGS